MDRTIAIIDDDGEDVEKLVRYIDKYKKEKNLQIRTRVYSNGLDFLEEYRPIYDIVLLDIEMPHIDGIETARKLREIDERVVLIFITRMAQYAISGYEVSALDFILKPIRYGTLAEKLERALSYVDRETHKDLTLFLNIGGDNFRKINSRDIYYIVKDRNYIVYVTKSGTFRLRGTLREVEETLKGSSIVQCAKGVMVNLIHIEQKVKNIVYINGMQFVITKPFLEQFTDALMQFLQKEK